MWWIALVLGALIAGASFVGILVAPSRTESLIALAGVLSFAASVYSLVAIAQGYGRVDAVLYGLAFMTAGVGGGWALTSTLLPSLPTRERQVTPPTQPPSGNPSPAVIVAICLEPERYGARSTARALQALTDEGLFQSSIGVLPFLFFAQKARYRAIGGTSPATRELAALSEMLEVQLAEYGIDRVDWAGCGGERRLAVRVIDAIDAGYEEIVIAHLSIADSLQMAAAERELDSLHLEELGVRVVHTEPLAGSDAVTAALIERILRSSAQLDVTGVVVLGHGQPTNRAHLDPAFDEMESAFLNRLRMALIEGGITENHARIGWTEWRQPDVTASVRHLAALGCERILVVPATYPLDTLVTRLDVELAVKQARVDDSVSVVTLPAWGEDPAIVDEFAQRVLKASSKVGTTQ